MQGKAGGSWTGADVRSRFPHLASLHTPGHAEACPSSVACPSAWLGAMRGRAGPKPADGPAACTLTSECHDADVGGAVLKLSSTSSPTQGSVELLLEDRLHSEDPPRCNWARQLSGRLRMAIKLPTFASSRNIACSSC